MFYGNIFFVSDNNAGSEQNMYDNGFCYCLANCDAIGYTLHKDQRYDTLVFDINIKLFLQNYKHSSLTGNLEIQLPAAFTFSLPTLLVFYVYEQFM